MSGTNGSHAPPDGIANVSKRIVDQRLRNRIIESVETLAEGPEGVRRVGFSDFFNDFYDLVPENCVPHKNTALTEEEVRGIESLCKVMSAAMAATPKIMSEEEFIQTGWSDEIMSAGRKTLAVFLRRGRFDEEVEEAEPSG
jgi:hypothetical protein